MANQEEGIRIIESLEYKLNKILVLTESEQPQSQILSRLDEICHDLSIPITVIGGMAVAAHGYRRFTNNIDILITRSDATKLADALLKDGLVDIGQNKFENSKSKVIINICVEGVKAGRSVFPAPSDSSPGVKVAELPLLLTLKARANKHKDRSDIVELIKVNDLTEEYLTANVLPKLQAMDQKLVLALLKTAIKEKHE